MTKYREILRLTNLGISQRQIVSCCHVSQKTVVKIQKKAAELGISWPLSEDRTDSVLEGLMFPKATKT